MNEQEVREIAEAAFKRQFGDIEIVAINIWPRLGFDDDSPVVEVKIIYDGEYEQVNARGFLRVQSELVSKAWREGKDDLGWPSLHFIPKSEIGQRDPASV